jgi:hypothetical protein
MEETGSERAIFVKFRWFSLVMMEQSIPADEDGESSETGLL